MIAANTEPNNTFPFLSHTKIPYYKSSNTGKLLNDDRDIMVTLSTAYQVYDQTMTVFSVSITQEAISHCCSGFISSPCTVTHYYNILKYAP